MKKKKLVYGVGWNDADYQVQEFTTIVDENGKKGRKLAWMCPFYLKWTEMLKRCYSPRYQEIRPTYIGCSICGDWSVFSKFKSWMEIQDWEGKELDKDILFPGNKVYGPATCAFVDKRVNTFSTECDASRGKYMIGVSWDSVGNKFRARCRDGSGKQKHIGYFDTELEAHKAWLAFKLEQAKILAAEQTDPRVAKALVERYENYAIEE